MNKMQYASKKVCLAKKQETVGPILGVGWRHFDTRRLLRGESGSNINFKEGV